MNNSDFTEATRKREDDNMVEPDYGNALKDEEIFSLVTFIINFKFRVYRCIYSFL